MCVICFACIRYFHRSIQRVINRSDETPQVQRAAMCKDISKLSQNWWISCQLPAIKISTTILNSMQFSRSCAAFICDEQTHSSTICASSFGSNEMHCNKYRVYAFRICSDIFYAHWMHSIAIAIANHSMHSLVAQAARATRVVSRAEHTIAITRQSSAANDRSNEWTNERTALSKRERLF